MFNPTIALDQLAMSNNGAGRLKCMIGAKDFFKNDEERSVGFKFMKGAKNKANIINIRLAGDDTYTVTFTKIWGTNLTAISEHKGIYFDMLKNLFESETSLYLSL